MLVNRYALPLIVAAWLLVTHFNDAHAPALPAAAPPASANDASSHGPELAGHSRPPSEVSHACVDKRPWPTAFGFAWTDGPGTKCAAAK
jgi:hypothetical protein